MFVAPLYRKFKNAANPQRFFKKSFIAAALVGGITAYGAAGVLAFNIIKTELNSSSNEASLTNLFAWNIVKKHGIKAGVALGMTYPADVAFLYAGLGVLYWRKQAKKNTNAPEPSKI